MPESRGRSALAPFSFPPLCKGRVGGVELNVHRARGGRHPSRRVYLPSPLLTKEGNRRSGLSEVIFMPRVKMCKKFIIGFIEECSRV